MTSQNVCYEKSLLHYTTVDISLIYSVTMEKITALDDRLMVEWWSAVYINTLGCNKFHVWRKRQHCRTSNINAIKKILLLEGRRGPFEGFVSALHCLETRKILFFDPYIEQHSLFPLICLYIYDFPLFHELKSFMEESVTSKNIRTWQGEIFPGEHLNIAVLSGWILKDIVSQAHECAGIRDLS